MEYAVDRIEGEIVVCQNLKNNKFENFEKYKMPQEIKEGDIFMYSNGKFTIDRKKTETKKAEFKKKLNDLFG